MNYELVYHEEVAKDFKKIPKADRGKILKAIESRLGIDPENFGKALTGVLKGFYRLRIGNYRMVYRIEKQKIMVYILQVGPRKDLKVYLDAARRLTSNE